MTSSQNPNVGTLRCPNCGGDAMPDSVRCAWCHSSLATVACPACFQSIFIGMRHCPWCGSEADRTESEQKAPGDCPCCQRQMVLVKVGVCLLTECTACGGLWVDKATFETICADREEQTAVLGRPASPVTGEKEKGPRRVYVACPKCGELMNRINFATCSGVLIDWCKPHGIWFDHSELARVVRFIQEGGMKKSREREKEQMQEDFRREREKQRELLRLERMGKRASSPDRLDWAGDSTPLLDFLSSVWKGMGD